MTTATPAEVFAADVKVDGVALDATWTDALREIRVEEALRVPARATVRFADDSYGLTAAGKVKLGSALTVTAYGGTVLFSGDVTGLDVAHDGFDHTELVVTAHDRAYRLARTSAITTYLSATASSIVTKVAQACGLQAKVTATSQVLEYALQVETNLALVDALADRCGYEWWVDASTLVFAPPQADGSPVQLTLGEDLLAFSARASGLHPDSVQVRGWDRDKQAALVGSAAQASGSAMWPSVSLFDPFRSPGSALGGASAVVSTAPAVLAGEEGTLGSAVRDRMVQAAVVARGRSVGNPGLRPRVAAKVTQAGPTSGTYHLTEVEHVYDETGYRTSFVAGERRPTTLVDTLSAPPARTSFGHTGLFAGVVTNINDPQKRGRIKVKLPALGDQVESGWARLATIGGGEKRGLVFLPEVGDEVLVGFEGGDPRQPVVLGGLFGQKSTIPDWDVQAGTVTARRITSRLGHIVELSDGKDPGTQHVLVQLADGNSKIRLGKDRVDVAVPGGVPMKLAAGSSSIEIGQDGSITLTGTTVTVKAQQAFSLTAPKAEIKADAQLALEGGGQATLKSNGMLQVQATGPLQAKGATVMIN